MNDRYSKLAFLHRVKERKTPSLSAQASFAPFSLKVAWSGKSLIAKTVTGDRVHILNSICRAVNSPGFPGTIPDFEPCPGCPGRRLECPGF